MISERETKDYIIKIANKDIRAQEEFFIRTYRYFYQVAISVVKNHEDAEDIVSLFFQDLYRISLKCVNVKNCRAYLVTSIKNLARTFINKATKFKTVDLNKAAALVACENKFFEEDTLHAFDTVLTREERRAIILVMYYEYTYRESAVIMKISLGKFQRLMKDALKKLRKYYKGK